MGGSTKKLGFGHTRGTTIEKRRKRRQKRRTAELKAANKDASNVPCHEPARPAVEEPAHSDGPAETRNLDSSGSRKYLFLDMDGVVCIDGIFRDQLLTRLHHIVEATGCLVVLSSDWRKTVAHRRLAAANLERYGVRLHGHTPVLPGTSVRPKEIIQWMTCFAAKGDDVSFVAIDDRPLLSEEDGHLLRTHFVHTKPSIGIDAAAQQKSIEILNGGPPGFVPSAKWHGRREGYSFKAGMRGVGYYIDPNQAAPSDFLPLPVSAPKSVPKRTNAPANRFAVLMQRHRPA